MKRLKSVVRAPHFYRLLLFGVLALTCLSASQAGRTNVNPPSFTDTRVAPVGDDRLDVADLVASDTWSVDLAMNHLDTEVNGKLTAEFQDSRVWSGNGPNDATTTIHTITDHLKTPGHYATGAGVIYYQYQFHDTRGSTHKQYDINPGPYSYQI